MSYPDRTAVTGAPIVLNFLKLITPLAMPDPDQVVGLPAFLCGEHETVGTTIRHDSNMPVIWCDIYQNSGLTAIGGALVQGFSHADQSLITVAEGLNPFNGSQFLQNGYIDGAYFAYSLFAADDDDDIELYYFRQKMRDELTGDASTIVNLNSLELATLAMPKDVDATGSSKIIASLGSTTTDPEALLLFSPQYVDGQSDTQDAIRLGLSGAPTKISLFQTATEQSLPIAVCRDDTNHFFLRLTTDYAYTICVENDFGVYTGDSHYTPKFSDAGLPVSYAALRDGTDPDFQHVHTYGTPAGFIIGYKKLNGTTWEPKWVLVDNEWTTVSHLTTTAGDATATAILAQGVGEDNEDMVSITSDGTSYWMLGGTAAVPKIVEANPGAVVNEDTILRVWGFSLDGHDYFVLRLGDSGTLVYDLTTDSIVEWASPLQDKWRAHVGQNWIGMADTTFANGFGSDIVAGDDTTGVLWVLDPTAGQDDDTSGDPVNYTRKVTGEIQLSGRDVLPCGAVTLDLSVGDPTDTGATITLRTSDDLGHNWRSHGALTVSSGDYGAVVEWRGLGLAKAPGRIFEISDDGAAVRIGAANLR